MIAVFLVAGVTSFNDYSKELQFRALKKFASTMESCTVIRDGGTHKSLNPKEIVVGDVLSIKGGDQCFADCCLFECDEKHAVMMDEAALTGESELVKKRCGGDPFLLSSTVCASHGNADDAKALVIGVGDSSQWGRIQAKLDQEDVQTPLQVSLHSSMSVSLSIFSLNRTYLIGLSRRSSRRWSLSSVTSVRYALSSCSP